MPGSGRRAAQPPGVAAISRKSGRFLAPGYRQAGSADRVHVNGDLDRLVLLGRGELNLGGVPLPRPHPLYEASASPVAGCQAATTPGVVIVVSRWRVILAAGWRAGRPPVAVAGVTGVYGGGGGGYGTAVGESAAVVTVGGVHGFPAVRTSFVGRAGPVREVTVLL